MINNNGNHPADNQRTFVMYVEDKPGVLNRVASLFRRRAFNIESLTVGHTELPGVSRMTIVTQASPAGWRPISTNWSMYSTSKMFPIRQA